MAMWRGARDLVFPPQSLDGGEAAMAGGLSAATWSRIHFLDGPVCDGCGTPFEYDLGARCAACVAKPRRSTRPARPASMTRCREIRRAGLPRSRASASC